MVPADSHRVPRAPRYSGYRYASRNYGYGAVILCGAAFQRLPLDTQVQSPGPTTPARPTRDTHRFGLFPVRSPLLGESLLFSLPGGTKMFQFPPFAPGLKAGRLPEAVRLPRSDIRGSMAACASPRLFAACRVLLRLLEPRYPPSALAFFSFTLGRLPVRRSRILVFV